MKKTNKAQKAKLPKVKVSYREFRPGSGIMAPQFDLGYPTDAVEIVREMRGHYN
jgi:hypothetical protein